MKYNFSKANILNPDKYDRVSVLIVLNNSCKFQRIVTNNVNCVKKRILSNQMAAFLKLIARFS